MTRAKPSIPAFLLAVLLFSSPLRAATVERWGLFELAFPGPAAGNAYLDVEWSATFRQGDRTITVPGFWDGGDRYKVRFSPPHTGEKPEAIELAGTLHDAVEMIDPWDMTVVSGGTAEPDEFTLEPVGPDTVFRRPNSTSTSRSFGIMTSACSTFPRGISCPPLVAATQDSRSRSGLV